MLSTELIQGDAKVRTVEHLLAALTGLGVDNARIEIDGAEVPLLDGSAQEWVSAIAEVGLVSQPVDRVTPSLTEPIWIYEGDAFVAAIPALALRFSYGIDFELAAIGQQWHSWGPDRGDSFAAELAPARTFGLAHQIDQLRASGLIKGGSLDNALVCGPEGWLNPPLRFSNEPVRHKLLDLIGGLEFAGSYSDRSFSGLQSQSSPAHSACTKNFPRPIVTIQPMSTLTDTHSDPALHVELPTEQASEPAPRLLKKQCSRLKKFTLCCLTAIRLHWLIASLTTCPPRWRSGSRMSRSMSHIFKGTFQANQSCRGC